ncbi:MULTISPECIES: hypothetical protein [unclassified Variovorax]|nr:MULTISPECIES: hypothetical protein [unclassified Variovorax]
MIDLATWGLFGVAVLALFASPGPNMALLAAVMLGLAVRLLLLDRPAR